MKKMKKLTIRIFEQTRKNILNQVQQFVNMNLLQGLKLGNTKFIRKYLFTILVISKKCKLLLFSIVLLANHAFGQSSCDYTTITLAEDYYNKGEFRNVIDNLVPCINSGFNNQQKIQAYRLLSLTYLAIDSTESAYNAAVSLISLNPNFEATSYNYPIRFVKIVNEIKNKGIATMVTSVSKKAESYLEAPASVMIITEDDIKERGYIDIEQLFSDIPGFDISRTYGITYSNLYQRGYRSDNTDRMLFLIDGVEDNDLWSGIAYISRQYPISNIKRVEVVYGPASTMYGANAFVGVVNVITKTPDEMAQNKLITANVNTGYGTYNTKYYDMSLSGKKNIVSYTLTGRGFMSDERNLSDYTEFDYNPDDYDNVNYQSILNVTTNANTFVKSNNISPTNELYTIVTNTNGDTTAANLTAKGADLARSFDKAAFAEILNGSSVKYSNKSEHYYFSGKVKIADFTIGFQKWKNNTGNANYYHDNKRMGFDNGSKWIQKHTLVYTSYSKKLGDNFTIQNIAQYRVTEVDDDSKTVEIINYSNKRLKATDLLAYKKPYFDEFTIYIGSRQFRDEVKAIYTPFASIDFVSGLEIRSSFIQGDYLKTKTDSSAMEFGMYAGNQKGGSNYYTIFDIGYYLQGTYRFGKMVKLTFGGRYDYNKIRETGGFGSQFNPRIALVATPRKFIGKVIYASAFQNSSIYKMFSTTSTRASNPNLNPEKVKNFEVSVGYKFSKNIYFDIDYFHSDYFDVVGAVDGLVLPNDKSQMYMNIGSLKIQGIQSNLNVKFKTYKMYLNYTYTNPRNNILNNDKLTGEYQPIADIATHKANLGINAVYFEKLNVNLRMNYVGEKKAGTGTTVPANPGEFPAYMLLNGAIGWNNIVKGLDLQLVCNNILNKEYFDPGIRTANVSTYSYRIPQRERVFIIRLMYNI